jgi:hypothetical protein
MGTEFLVACLWVVVLIYWFWSRLPARADTAGVYRRALHVLEHATPQRVVPAYRLRTPAIVSASAPHPAFALCHKRAQIRRRRRDTLSVLLGAVVVSFAAALLIRSTAALAVQVLCDLALASYVSLLVRAARASVGAAPTRRNPMVQNPMAQTLAAAPALSAAYAAVPVAEEPVRLRAQIREAAAEVATYVPAHALRHSDLRVVMSDTDEFAEQSLRESYSAASYAPDGYGDESYGDFDSYASLALVSAR